MAEKITNFDLEERLDACRNNFRRESGERLKHERIRLGLSQAEFAKKVGIHRNTQAKYEAGERDPDASYYQTLAELGVGVPYVINGERLEGFPENSSILTRNIFEEASNLGLTDLYPEAIARLIYLVAKDDAQSSIGFDDTLESNQRTALITAAFKRGEVFSESAIAISKYGSRITGKQPSLKDEAALILETLEHFDKVEVRISIRDTIRLIADDLVEAQVQEKAENSQ